MHLPLVRPNTSSDLLSHSYRLTDRSYWSASSSDEPDFASQRTLYEDLGVELLDHAFEGFNVCILAYGQTGSGKSYTMMGYGNDKGLIPLTTEELFRRIDEKKQSDPSLEVQVEASYLEIYNEKVRDLLNTSNTGALKVREHPALGPYVENLSQLVVADNAGMMTLMDEGTQLRTVAATQMNATSSRSHAIFQLTLTQRRLEQMTQTTTETVSKISLVDLAGSERANSTGASGSRLKEGAQINKSLTTLGKCVQALASASSGNGVAKNSGKRDDFVPFRDSTLTWLLKESLGGNSKTAIIAAISPTDYDETLSTLRYANQAKQIRTRAVVNEDPNAKMIRELREELEMLRSRASSSSNETVFDPTIPPEKQMVTYQTKDGELRTVSKLELQDALDTNQRLMASLNETWEERLRRTAQVQVEREKALAELGISIDKTSVGIHAPQRFPHLVNLSEDPLMAECLVYQLSTSRTTIGSIANASASIKLSGPRVAYNHCHIDIEGDRVSLTALEDGINLVNGRFVQPGVKVPLESGYRIILDVHIFRFVAPEAARRRREQSLADSRKGTPDQGLDWEFAKREAALAILSVPDSDLDNVEDEVLDTLFEDLLKAKAKRRPDSRLGIVSSTPEPHFSASDVVSIEIETPPVETHAPVYNTPPSHARRFSRRSTSGYFSDEEDRKLLESQTKALDSEIRRLRHHAAQASISRRSQQTIVTILTVQEKELATEAVARWRSIRAYAMAEKLLVKARLVREANILAQQQRLLCSYDFTVITPTDGDAPDVGIRVIDGKSFYVWPFAEFERRLKVMRATASGDHFEHAHSFRKVDPAPLTLIGSAMFSMSACLSVPAKLRVPIFDLHLNRIIGTASVSISISTPQRGPAELEFCLDDVSGFDRDQFAELCANISLSSLIGPVDTEGVLSSNVVDLDTSDASQLVLRRTLKLQMDLERREHLRDALAEARFFCRPTRKYLDQLEAIPRPLRSRQPAAPSSPAHALLNHLQLEELGANGEWLAVEVHQNTAGPPVFHIHQGLQRRLRIGLSHHSADSMVLADIGTVSILSIRSAAGVESDRMVELQTIAKTVADAEASCTSLWDSAAHDCPRLNRTSDDPLTIKLSFLLDLKQSTDPAVVEYDFNCKVLARDAGPSSSLFSFFRSSNVSDRQSETLSITFEPSRSRDPSQLWDLDTSLDHLPGDAILNGWVPRGPEIVNGYERLRSAQVKQAHLEAIRHRLRQVGELPRGLPAITDERLRSIVNDWRNFVHSHKPTEINPESPEEMRNRQALRRLVPEARSSKKPTVKRINAL